jgi:hypothetical protein
MRQGRHLRLGATMRFIAQILFVLIWPSAIFAADGPRHPIDMEQLLQDLRDMDSSTDMEGDHVVGEQLC